MHALSLQVDEVFPRVEGLPVPHQDAVLQNPGKLRENRPASLRSERVTPEEPLGRLLGRLGAEAHDRALRRVVALKGGHAAQRLQPLQPNLHLLKDAPLVAVAAPAVFCVLPRDGLRVSVGQRSASHLLDEDQRRGNADSVKVKARPWEVLPLAEGAARGEGALQPGHDGARLDEQLLEAAGSERPAVDAGRRQHYVAADVDEVPEAAAPEWSGINHLRSLVDPIHHEHEGATPLVVRNPKERPLPALLGLCRQVLQHCGRVTEGSVIIHTRWHDGQQAIDVEADVVFTVDAGQTDGIHSGVVQALHPEDHGETVVETIQQARLEARHVCAKVRNVVQGSVAALLLLRQPGCLGLAELAASGLQLGEVEEVSLVIRQNDFVDNAAKVVRGVKFGIAGVGLLQSRRTRHGADDSSILDLLHRPPQRFPDLAPGIERSRACRLDVAIVIPCACCSCCGLRINGWHTVPTVVCLIPAR
mmetsp:Transcript_23791/g.59837  ORF Transcript_23791/g.59837 Transcript_23791/m.59837 type:complete len:475 (-) Transcript_23791:1475-2899(-)